MTITIALIYFQCFQIGFLSAMLFDMLRTRSKDKKKQAYDKLVADVAEKVKHG